MTRLLPRSVSVCLAFLAVAFVWMPVGGVVAIAQVSTTTSATTNSAGKKSWAFEVVSVRQNQSVATTRSAPQYGPTADGYRMTNLPLMVVLMTAYVPQSGGGMFTNNIVGMPDWVRNDRYDINAKISEADMAEWQKPASQKVMLQAMLQEMLTDRFKLVVHREMKETAIYALVVGKGGPKFKETTPDEPHPGTVAIPGGGGFMAPGDGGGKVRFIDTTMVTFASIISNLAGHPIQDKTGLAGRYDLSFQKPTPMGSPSASQDAADPGPTIFSAMEELGLKLEPAKGETETLVIDHMERPSAN